MGSKVVFRSLTELFPQIDARILKAVAIEHPKDVNDAAAVVISEFIPLFYPNLVDDSSTTQSGDKTPVDAPDNKVEERDMQNSALTGSKTVASSSGTRAPTTELLSDINQSTNVMPNGGDVHIQSTSTIGLSGSTDSRVVSSDLPDLVEAETKLTSDASQGVGFHVTANQDESGRRTVSEDAETSDAESSYSTSKDSLAVENGEPELGDAFSSVVSRSTQGCNIDHLEEIIEDAKSNKRTLFTVMESIMNLMREVELEEKDAEKLKEDATRAGFDTLNKVEDLKKILAHAKERNDMDAGEVYGERSILSTEVTELENRLLNLSEDRDKSLSVLHEMRGVLETRLEAALEIKNAAEQERQEKEGCARKALAEQEAFMEKVVQESKLLQQEAEENSKLREFLMDRGRIVDSLQGEISVICQDIRHLKEKFDNRVPLSQSISSSQTSCKLASSVSSMKSLLLEKPSEPSYETPEASENDESPKALVNEGKDERKELLEDGWDIFDKETEL